MNSFIHSFSSAVDYILRKYLILVFSGGSEEYSGHYILVYAYEATADAFLYLDPSGRNLDGEDRVSSAVFDLARKHHGTDEDILICRR